MNASGSSSSSSSSSLFSTSRYESLAPIGTGGMATVFVGRTRGGTGFTRYVALKRAHAHVKTDERLAASMKLEARLASRLHHANVVSVLDVEEDDGDLILVLDYVEGCTLRTLGSKLDKLDERRPREIIRIILDVAAGLHAAHQSTDEDGRLLGLVHRDVSPSNVLVGVDGVARIADFGIAKAILEATDRTETGILKGKSSYMAPEYVMHQHASAQSDLFSLAVVAWEALTRERLFKGSNELDTLKRVMRAETRPLTEVDPSLGAIDHVLQRALARLPSDRYASVEHMAIELESIARAYDLVATHAEVSDLVERVARTELEERRRILSSNDGLLEDIETVVASSPLLRAASSSSSPSPRGRDDVRAGGSVLKPPSMMIGDQDLPTRIDVAPASSRSNAPMRAAARSSAPHASEARVSVRSVASIPALPGVRRSDGRVSVSPISVSTRHSQRHLETPPQSAPPPRSSRHLPTAGTAERDRISAPPPSSRAPRSAAPPAGRASTRPRRGRELLALLGAFILLGLALTVLAVQLGFFDLPATATTTPEVAASSVSAASAGLAPSASSSAVPPAVSAEAGAQVVAEPSTSGSSRSGSGHRRSPSSTTNVSGTLAPKKTPPNPPQSSAK